jgi:hypothetical protein
MRPFLKGPGFVSAGMGLVSAPGLKEGVPGELVAVARASQGGAIGLGPDLAATLEFEVLDDSNPINVVQGFGVGDPLYWYAARRPSLLVPEPTGALLIGVLALLGQQSRRLQRKPPPPPPPNTTAAPVRGINSPPREGTPTGKPPHPPTTTRAARVR